MDCYPRLAATGSVKLVTLPGSSQHRCIKQLTYLGRSQPSLRCYHCVIDQASGAQQVAKSTVPQQLLHSRSSCAHWHMCCSKLMLVHRAQALRHFPRYSIAQLLFGQCTQYGAASVLLAPRVVPAALQAASQQMGTASPVYATVLLLVALVRVINLCLRSSALCFIINCSMHSQGYCCTHHRGSYCCSPSICCLQQLLLSSKLQWPA